MAFKRVEEMDEDDFLMSMRQSSRLLKIIEVKDLRESESGEGGYRFLHYPHRSLQIHAHRRFQSQCGPIHRYDEEQPESSRCGGDLHARGDRIPKV